MRRRDFLSAMAAVLGVPLVAKEATAKPKIRSWVGKAVAVPQSNSTIILFADTTGRCDIIQNGKIIGQATNVRWSAGNYRATIGPINYHSPIGEKDT